MVLGGVKVEDERKLKTVMFGESTGAQLSMSSLRTMQPDVLNCLKLDHLSPARLLCGTVVCNVQMISKPFIILFRNSTAEKTRLGVRQEPRIQGIVPL